VSIQSVVTRADGIEGDVKLTGPRRVADARPGSATASTLRPYRLAPEGDFHLFAVDICEVGFVVVEGSEHVHSIGASRPRTRVRVATTEEFDSFVAIRVGLPTWTWPPWLLFGGLRVVEVTMSPPRGAAAYRTFTAGRIRVAVGPSVGADRTNSPRDDRPPSAQPSWHVDGCAFVP